MSFCNRAKRITIVTGHFGSGKTEFALNYALRLADTGKRILIIDFDLVNPYYRAKDAENYLKKHGIEIIAPGFVNSNVESLTLTADVMRAFDDKSKYVVFDVGGDDDGAVPLGVYYEHFIKSDYDMFFVLNERRMMTNDIGGSYEIYRDIAGASRLNFTGIVNNTHLMNCTEHDTIYKGEELANEFSKKVGLPVVCTCICHEFLDRIGDMNDLKFELFPLDLFVGPDFQTYKFIN